MASSEPLLQNTKFEELCRLCGSKTDMLAVHIFDDEGTFSELGKKIYNCLQLQIHQQDELPKLLCDNCLVKLEMFWDFKDRSFRTEQLLIELYKQLKNGGSHQQCVVSLDANGMLMQVPNHEILQQNELPDDIDISELGRKGNTPDYAIILHQDDLHAPHLENLELENHDLSSGQDLSNHSLQPPSSIVRVTEESAGRFTGENLSLVHQQILDEAQFKMNHNLHISMANNSSVSYATADTALCQEKVAEVTYNTHNRESGKDHLGYATQKDSLGLESALSDNSLGVDVDSSFDRIISYSSDSQLDQIQTSGEQENDKVVKNSANDIGRDEFLLHDSALEHGNDLINLSAAHSNNGQRVVQQSQSSLYVPEFDMCYENSRMERSEAILNYEETSLDGLKNEDSNSLLGSITQPSSLPVRANAAPDGDKGVSKPGSKICGVCGKVYKSNYKLAEHMTKHTGERPYKCRSCDKAFRSKIGLAQHEAKHTGQYDLTCPTCGKGFQCRSYLMVHQRVHSDLKPFPCTTCGINFKTKQSLLDHTNRHLGVKPFSCSICNRGFITKSLCVAHERTHTGVDNRKYSCKVCQKRFVSKSYLQTHFRIHTGEKPFICEVCGKGFLTRVDLKIHLTMHTGEKSYVCEMCGKAFARRDALKCHRRMHTGERPYRCDVCGRTFTQFTPMANHRRCHTGEKPFTCEVCGKTFVSKSTMVSHQKKHTSKKPQGKVDDADSPFLFATKEELTIEEHSL